MMLRGTTAGKIYILKAKKSSKYKDSSIMAKYGISGDRNQKPNYIYIYAKQPFKN